MGQTLGARLFRAAMIDALDINEVMTKYLSQRTREQRERGSFIALAPRDARACGGFVF